MMIKKNCTIKFAILLAIITLPGCRKVSITRQFSNLQRKTKQITDADIMYTPVACNVGELEEQLAQGISRDEAIAMALANNPDLQADFENLGIAQADLAQAGLYTNPTINSVFRFPTQSQGPGTAQMNIESVASFRLADLWQVPLTKEVAEDVLEITTLRILTTILDTAQKAAVAFDEYVQAQATFANAQESLREIKDYKDEVYYRQNYGYSSDLDKYHADIMLNTMELEVIRYMAMHKTAAMHLKKILGLDPSETPVQILNNPCCTPETMTLDELERYALENRPEIQIAHIKIKQYKDTIALEKARIWNNVDIGIAYKQDFDRPFRGWGPYVAFNVPVFDDNHAQIARAEFLLRQAEKELYAETIKVKEEIRKAYVFYNSLEKELDIYNKHILPTRSKAITWASKYTRTMQVNGLVEIQTKIDLYETKKNLITTQYKLMHSYAELERAVGKRLI